MASEIYTTGEYIAKNPTWHMEDSSWKAQQILKIIEKNHLQPQTVAEVGCGGGEILKQLYAEMPKDVTFTGYEISPQAFQLCQQKTQDRLKFKLANIIQEEGKIFDLILCIDVFEHIQDYLGFLQQIKPKTDYHIFHIPLDISVSSVLRSTPILRAREQVGHLHYFTKETALATLKDAGYEIIDYFYTAGSTELNISSLKTRIAKFPRNILYRINPDLAVRLMGGYSLLVLAK
ncbi:class I SAM-dependent methyltransferase [Merismopedia glauca]|uniref:Methylase n=1 Tax=Merismopedia glauca CCAP 1448/3 TaxID=1296344 RepID=A0A2T1C775_9CYAN|nr:class I SAM-dependent methyltransferase [Merismopedia glauca]PSB04084.1 methylase [Merismopedia glauca CCAP 1448/3]